MFRSVLFLTFLIGFGIVLLSVFCLNKRPCALKNDLDVSTFLLGNSDLRPSEFVKTYHVVYFQPSLKMKSVLCAIWQGLINNEGWSRKSSETNHGITQTFCKTQ